MWLQEYHSRRSKSNLCESFTKPLYGHQNPQKTCHIWVAVFITALCLKLTWSYNQCLAKSTETIILINKFQTEKYKIICYDKKNGQDLYFMWIYQPHSPYWSNNQTIMFEKTVPAISSMHLRTHGACMAIITSNWLTAQWSHPCQLAEHNGWIRKRFPTWPQEQWAGRGPPNLSLPTGTSKLLNSQRHSHAHCAQAIRTSRCSGAVYG